MAKKIPVYNIGDFIDHQGSPEFYVNDLSWHVAHHTFTNLPHKHDFYLVILVTAGSGWHEIDFVKYRVRPGSVFLMQPGQMHYWHLSSDIRGYVLFHSKTFYDEGYTFNSIQDFSFYKSFQSLPAFFLKNRTTERLILLFKAILSEYKHPRSLSTQKIRSLINLIYIEVAREYPSISQPEKQSYLHLLQEFEKLIEEKFRTIKHAGDYAALLNISAKHLNRIVKETIGKTSTQLIAERILLEARRLLIQGKLNVTEIADVLGFSDKSYFVRFFRKNAGETPTAFLKGYLKN